MYIFVAGRHKHDAVAKVVAGATFCELLEKCGSFAKIILFQLCKQLLHKRHRKSLIFNFKLPKLEASREVLVLDAIFMKLRGSPAANARFGSLLCEIWRRSHAKPWV